MKLAMQLALGQNFAKAARLTVDLEKVGLDVVWVPEAYGFDAPSLMGYLAARTEKVEIGAGIVNIYSRTPTLLAMTAAGVDELSNGRCILGLGASGPPVIEGFHGVRYDRPVTRTRETIEICRRVWARKEPLVHHGAVYQIPLPGGKGSTELGKPLKIIGRPRRDNIPIWVAAIGDNNVAMTAEVAEGWLPAFFLPDKAGDVFGPSLKDGLSKRDPALGPLQIAAGGILALGEEAEVAPLRERGRAAAALYIGGMGARGKNFYNRLVCRYGYEKEAKEIQDLYLDGKKEEAAVKVPADLMEAMSLCGPEGYIKDRIAAYRESGVTQLNISPVGTDPVALIEKVRSWL
jgi:F420-dependent oxidoreductase-like protein